MGGWVEEEKGVEFGKSTRRRLDTLETSSGEAPMKGKNKGGKKGKMKQQEKKKREKTGEGVHNGGVKTLLGPGGSTA